MHQVALERLVKVMLVVARLLLPVYMRLVVAVALER
jgi:hypothetical protein